MKSRDSSIDVLKGDSAQIVIEAPKMNEQYDWQFLIASFNDDSALKGHDNTGELFFDVPIRRFPFIKSHKFLQPLTSQRQNRIFCCSLEGFSDRNKKNFFF